jgi:6-pyruvoyltetrahydropterin/6-carboxytetrahydropterin synthase
MKTVQVIRRERFNAAHRLFNPNWSDEKNEQIFGKCANKNWHGHNYTLFVTVEGNVDPDTGYVIDLKVLSDIIKNRIVNKMDHKNLNLEVDFMKDTITTAENIAIMIYKELESDIRATGNNLYSVKLYETENNYVEYYG